MKDIIALPREKQYIPITFYYKDGSVNMKLRKPFSKILVTNNYDIFLSQKSE